MWLRRCSQVSRQGFFVRCALCLKDRSLHRSQIIPEFTLGPLRATLTASKGTLWPRKRVIGSCILPIASEPSRFAPVVPFMFDRNKSRLAKIALAVLLWNIAGCGGPSHDIVGKWRMSGEPNATVWEFTENGGVVIGNTRGRYILDRDRVKIDTPFAKTVYQMEFSADRMILREPSGPKLEFARLR